MNTRGPATPESPAAQKKWPKDVIALLVALSGAVVLFQYVSLEKFSSLRLDLRYDLPNFVKLTSAIVPLDGFDYLLGIAICSLFLILVVLEVWSRRFSRFLAAVFESESMTLGTLALGSILLLRFYLARGTASWQADAISHLSYAWAASRGFQMGEIPIWTNAFGTGGPFLQFYGFLFFYLVGLLNLLVGDLYNAVKLVLSGSHVVSGLGMYLYLRCACGSRRAGFLGAIGYVLCFWHTQQVLIMGRLPLALFYAGLPWPFYFYERLRFRRHRVTAVLGGGLSLGLLAFVHPGYAFWATVFLGFYVTTRTAFGESREARLLSFSRGFLILGVGILFGAYLTVPMWFERAFVGLNTGFSLSGFPDPTWKHLMAWSNYRLRFLSFQGQHWYGGYLGLSLIGIAAVGIFGMLRGTHPHTRRLVPIGFGLGLSLLLVFGYRWPLLRSLSVVQAFNSGRYLLFVTFFLSASAGTAALVLPRISHRKGSRAYALAVLILILDLGATTFQHPYVPRDREDGLAHISPDLFQRVSSEADAFSEDGRLPDFRFVYVSDVPIGFLPDAWLTMRSQIPSPFSAYNEAPLTMGAFCYPLKGLVTDLFTGLERVEDLSTHPQFGLVQAGLFLLNVRHLFSYRSNGETLYAWTMPNHGPVVVAPEAMGWDSWEEVYAVETVGGTEVERLIASMDVRPAAGTCARIFLEGHAAPQELGSAPKVEVLEHRVFDQIVELRLRTSAPCFARLSYAYYPYLSVTVNGEPVRARMSAGGFLILDLEAGDQQIVLTARMSPLRKGLLALDLAGLGAFGLWVSLRYGARKWGRRKDGSRR